GPRDSATNLFLIEERIDEVNAYVGDWLDKSGLYQTQIATLHPTDLAMTIRGSSLDAILHYGRDVLLLQSSVPDDGNYLMTRMGTTLADIVGAQLFSLGIDGLLATDNQLALAEAAPTIPIIDSIVEQDIETTGIDFHGPFGVYFRELFFHI